jgi:hypothetical protein
LQSWESKADTLAIIDDSPGASPSLNIKRSRMINSASCLRHSSGSVMSAAIVVSVAVVLVVVVVARWIVAARRGGGSIVILVMVGRVIGNHAATRVVDVMIGTVVLAMATLIVIQVVVGRVIRSMGATRVVGVLGRADILAMATIMRRADLVNAAPMLVAVCVMMKGLEGGMKRRAARRGVAILQPLDPQSPPDSIAVFSHG